MKITKEALLQGLDKIEAALSEDKKLAVVRWPEAYGYVGEVEGALIYVEGEMTPGVLSKIEAVAIEYSGLAKLKDDATESES